MFVKLKLWPKSKILVNGESQLLTSDPCGGLGLRVVVGNELNVDVSIGTGGGGAQIALTTGLWVDWVTKNVDELDNLIGVTVTIWAFWECWVG